MPIILRAVYCDGMEGFIWGSGGKWEEAERGGKDEAPMPYAIYSLANRN